MMYVISGFAIWVLGWLVNLYLANSKWSDYRAMNLAIPLIFGLTVLLVWECFVIGFEVNPVFLPRPSDIVLRMAIEMPRLWADFVQTIIKGALTGYILGGLAAFAIALLADRSEFLTRGVLPVGSFMAALPIVGIAPIFVKWFGSNWESKAAVVAVMVFFPILVNVVAGMRDTTSMQRDLMRTYGAGYWPTLAQTAPSSCDAVHFQWLEGRYNIISDRRDRCRVLWLPNRWNGISHFHQLWPTRP